MDKQPLRIENDIDEVEERILEGESSTDKISEEFTGDRIEEEDLTEEDTESKLRMQLEESQAQASEYLDGWQRARAEFANARKRLEKQRTETYRHAAADFSRKLLPVVDDFNRAVNSPSEEIAEDKWFEGITLVHKKLVSVLEEMNVEPIEALGQPFDPNYHEALALVEADGFESGTVVEELQTGYRIGEMVLRPSLVNVAA